MIAPAVASIRGALIAALALALLAGVGLWGAWSIPHGPGFSSVGPSAFPMVLASTLALLAIAMVVQALRGRVPDEAQSTDEPPLAGANERIGWMLAGMVGAPLGLLWFGFLIGGIIGFATVARAFGARSWAAIFGYSAVSTLVVWLLFDRVLTLKLGNELLRLPF
ncbi:MAG: tripartite tricarboxylate transporter TctB family protein [Burkholderiales bacterium]